MTPPDARADGQEGRSANPEDPAVGKGSPGGSGQPKPLAFTPDVFGKYFLLDKIAIGGMAEIFKAKTFSHGGFEKLLVIKRILAHLSESEEFVQMFMDEAKVSVKLQHANIVQTYDFGRIQDNYFIAMECVEGKDIKALLRKLARQRKLLPAEFAVYVAHEVCKALDYAHRRVDEQGRRINIVHRDVSPSNVLISYEADVKITDFGISKAATNRYDTKAGVLKGKFEYMSPEQASGQEVDHRSDIFSTGIILYECLTGRRLFKSSSEIRTLEAIKACEVEPPSVLNPAISPRLDEIVMRALARDPSARYQEAQDFQNDLLEVLYPATPDRTRQSLAYFLQLLFQEEMEDERLRLETGTRAALELYSRAEELELDESWEETGPASGTLRTRSSRTPMYLALAALLIMLGIVGFLVFGMKTSQQQPLPPPQPLTASISVRVNVPAQVILDGYLLGEGALIDASDVVPGQHNLKVVAEGYKPHEEPFNLAEGQRYSAKIVLEPQQVREPEPPPAPRPAQVAAPAQEGQGTADPPGQITPRVRFTSSPSGAWVKIDGRNAGRTPLTWNGGPPGQKISVEYSLDGYQTLSFGVEIPEQGESISRSRTLQKIEAPPGKISVNVSQSWAWVFIDGVKISETPVYNHQLSAGQHQVRVVNEALGLDQSKTITVTGGESKAVFFSNDTE